MKEQRNRKKEMRYIKKKTQLNGRLNMAGTEHCWAPHPGFQPIVDQEYFEEKLHFY